MRVAVVCPYDLSAPGGVQDQVVALVRGLTTAGHEAWAVAPGSGGPPGTRHVGRAVGVRANRSRAPIALDPRAARRVAEAVGDADVVHVHEPLMPMVSLAAMLTSRPPVVATFHADPAVLVRRLYRAGSPILRRIAGRAAVMTAVSPVAADPVSSFGPVRIVPNGVDIASFSGPGQALPGRVVFLGRDEPRKGLDVLLQAWPLIAASRPRASLHVLGAHRPSGPDAVTFLGRVDDAAKREELAAASVFCAPHLGGESFGIVLVEAMGAGCAVVASDLPAFRSVAGEAAFYVPPGDPPALAAAVGRLLDDPSAGAALIRDGHVRARCFDMSTVRDQYAEAYREAMG